MSHGSRGATTGPRTGRVAVLLAAATVAAIDLTAKAASEARLADSSVDLHVRAEPTTQIAEPVEVHPAAPTIADRR